MPLIFRLRRVCEVRGGIVALLQLLALRLFIVLLRPARYRGLGRLAVLVGRAIRAHADNAVVVPVFVGASFRIWLNDYYWVRLLSADVRYETELEALFAQVLHPRCGFLDCGANIGYWSIYATEVIGRPSCVIAVEAGANTFSRLQQNAALNGCRFTCVNAAVSEKSDQTVHFIDNRNAHAGAHIIPEGDARSMAASNVVAVKTVTIDTLVADHADLDHCDTIIIKLDVEGAEIAALRGATETLRSRNVLVIYEDHGSDRTHSCSRFVMDSLHYLVFGVVGGELVRIVALQEIAEIKRHTDIGYNFFTCSPESAIAETLLALCSDNSGVRAGPEE